MAVSNIWDAPGPGGLPSLGVQLKQANEGFTSSMQEGAAAAKKSQEVQTAGAEKLKTINDQAPALPQLNEIPDKFQYKPMSQEQMTSAMQSMFAFAAIGGAMTRTPMTAALKAFSGGLEGLVKGDMESFKRQTQEFDRNMKVAIAKNQEALQRYKTAIDKHKDDRQAALAEIQLQASALNDTATYAQARAGMYKNVINQVQAMGKAGQQAEQHHSEVMARIGMESRRADQMDRRLDMMERQGDARIDLQRQRDELKAKAAAQGGKPTATERQHYVDSNQLLKSVDRIREMLRNPELQKKIDDAQFAGVLSDTVESKLIQQYLVRPNLDPQVKKYLQEISVLRNQYYLDQSGKAVTGGEALRNYGAVVQPGDKSADVLSKMDVAEERTREKMKDMRTYFPSLGAIDDKGGDLKSQVESAGVSYEPDKYEYRIMDGKVQRKLK